MRLVDKLKKNFAKNLQTLRNRKELTQAKLAEQLLENYKHFDFELQRTSIVNYETESAMPRIDALYCIADYFGKTIDELISPNALEVHPQLSRIRTRIQPDGTLGRNNLEEADCLVDELQVSQQEQLNKILRDHVDALSYRQFYIELTKTFLLNLHKGAPTEEERMKITALFRNTFLECLSAKSGHFRDLAANMLDKEEFVVFMAFQESDGSIEMIAQGLGMDQTQVLEIYYDAQIKIKSYIERLNKS
jgi:transcriptional regulator with XRE-family HTH domain